MSSIKAENEGKVCEFREEDSQTYETEVQEKCESSSSSKSHSRRRDRERSITDFDSEDIKRDPWTFHLISQKQKLRKIQRQPLTNGSLTAFIVSEKNISNSLNFGPKDFN